MSNDRRLSAWDGIFTAGQLTDISNMYLYCCKNGLNLKEEIRLRPPLPKSSATIRLSGKSESRNNGFIKKPIRQCPKCGGTLKVFSLSKKDRAIQPGMKSKWECCKTCKGSSCGYVEYISKDVETIIEEVKNGSPK